MIIESNKSKPFRAIHTARNLEAINRAVDEGFFPLIRELKPSPKLYATYCVFRHRKTNKVETAEAEKGYGSHGMEYSYSRDEWDMVISYAKHYPYQFSSAERYPFKFSSPFAAYLIPSDITLGERVVIEDLIEDYFGGTFWSKNIRLETLEAIWNGSDLVIQYDPDVDGVCTWVG